MNSDERVYEAEKMLYTGEFTKRFGSAEDAREFLWAMQTDAWFVKRWPRVAKRDIVIKRSKNYKWAGAYVPQNEILLPVWAMNNLVLVHEMAHFCAPPRAKEGDHHPAFCAAECLLVDRYVQRGLGKRLRWAFLSYDQGVA